VFCSFLALMLQKELADLCRSDGLVIEWADTASGSKTPQISHDPAGQAT
jgi:hypothetical protein